MIFLFLIILDFIWSASAFWYDADKLITLSPLLWPVVAVCPVFPFLLALVLLQLYRKKSPNQFLLAFAAISSAVYGVLAILYYPIAMYYQGFSWNAFGQIFWVLFYALQGFWLIRKFKIDKFPFALVSILLVLQLVIIDFYYKSFGYFDFTGISSNLLLWLVIIAIVSLGIIYKFGKS